MNGPASTPSPTWIVAGTSGVLLLLHLFLRLRHGDVSEGLDAVALALAAIALIPWIANLLESLKIGGVEMKFVQERIDLQEKRVAEQARLVAEQERLSRQQASQIEVLELLVSALVSYDEMQHLKKLASGEEFLVDAGQFAEQFQRELRHLRDLGLINGFPGRGVRSLYGEPGQMKRVNDHFHITDAGRRYITFREEVETDKERAS